jgi:hypothetical protein
MVPFVWLSVDASFSSSICFKRLNPAVYEVLPIAVLKERVYLYVDSFISTQNFRYLFDSSILSTL